MGLKTQQLRKPQLKDPYDFPINHALLYSPVQVPSVEITQHYGTHKSKTSSENRL